jgi:hypothetical protein
MGKTWDGVVALWGQLVAASRRCDRFPKDSRAAAGAHLAAQAF